MNTSNINNKENYYRKIYLYCRRCFIRNSLKLTSSSKFVQICQALTYVKSHHFGLAWEQWLLGLYLFSLPTLYTVLWAFCLSSLAALRVFHFQCCLFTLTLSLTKTTRESVCFSGSGRLKCVRTDPWLQNGSVWKVLVELPAPNHFPAWVHVAIYLQEEK